MSVDIDPQGDPRVEACLALWVLMVPWALSGSFWVGVGTWVGVVGGVAAVEHYLYG